MTSHQKSVYVRCAAIRSQGLAANTADDARYCISLAEAHDGVDAHPATIARMRASACDMQEVAATLYQRARQTMGVE